MNQSEPKYSAKIREFRKSRDWTQEQLAGISGVSERTIQRIESGDPAALDSLKALATAFDMDVSAFIQPENAAEKKSTKSNIEFFPRLSSGKTLLDTVTGCHAYQYDHDPLNDDQEAAVVGNFLQDLKDTGEIWDDMEPAYRVECSVRLNSELAEVETAGFLVFGAKVSRSYRYSIAGQNQLVPMEVAVVAVIRKDNPSIIRGSLAEDVISKVSSEPKLEPAV